MFDFVHDEGAFHGAEAVDGTEFVEQNLLILGDVADVDLEEVVEVARDVVALGDLGDFGDATDEVEGYVVVHPGEFDTAEDYEGAVELSSIEDGDVLLDDALPLQSFQAFEDGRGGQVNGVCQLFGGELGVALESA